MSDGLFIDNIINNNIENLAIIGIGKNAGKTVSFNTLIREAKDRDLQLALLSYGRDGEEIDALTRQEKPRIYIPERTIFVTAADAQATGTVRADLIAATGIKSLLGEVNIYYSRQAGYVELVGVNSSTKTGRVISLLPDIIDLKLIDGALDRRSSALPALSNGFILATGAVAGNREELVVQKTLLELEKLTLPAVEDKSIAISADRLFAASRGGIITEGGKIISLNNHLLFNGVEEIKKKLPANYSVLIVDGALVDSTVDRLINRINLQDCYLLVRDGTRVFLDHLHLQLLTSNNIKLRVLNPMHLLGVTVNPFNPVGPSLAGDVIVDGLRSELPDVPVYDLRSREYRELTPYVYH